MQRAQDQHIKDLNIRRMDRSTLSWLSHIEYLLQQQDQSTIKFQHHWQVYFRRAWEMSCACEFVENSQGVGSKVKKVVESTWIQTSPEGGWGVVACYQDIKYHQRLQDMVWSLQSTSYKWSSPSCTPQHLGILQQVAFLQSRSRKVWDGDRR